MKARGRGIAGKTQNISEITNIINHEIRVYLVNRRVSASLFEIFCVFLTLIHFIFFKKRYGKCGMENEEKKQGKHIYEIRLSLTCHFFSLLFTLKPKKRTNLELDDLDELNQAEVPW